jgi:hypothetical protein
MYPRSSPREKAFAIGGMVFFGGLVWMSWLDDHPNPSRIHAILRTVAACCFLFGWLAGTAGFFTGVWDRNPGIRAIPPKSRWCVLAAYRGGDSVSRCLAARVPLDIPLRPTSPALTGLSRANSGVAGISSKRILLRYGRKPKEVPGNDRTLPVN